MKNQISDSPEVRARAIRLVLEQQKEHESQWPAIKSIASKIGCTAETLRTWVRRTEVDQGIRGGMSTADRERLKELEQENRELKRAHEILRKASACCSIEAVEFATLEWMDWFNNRRLLEPIENIPPAESVSYTHLTLPTSDLV